MAFFASSYSNIDLFEEVKETSLREGISSIAQYRDLIDELIEEKRIYGFFSEDEDLVQVKENLEKRWQEVARAAFGKVGKPIF